ncbi:MAG: HIG1 domain-containing protein [Maricaulaceae bacterium]
MIYILYVVTVLAFVGVVVSLVAGGMAMQSKAEGARERSNKWMQRRVQFQIVAVLLLLLVVYVRSRGA